MDKKQVKEFVKSTLAQNKVITAEWDAGGDDTPCWFRVVNEKNEEDKDIEKYESQIDALRDYIIDTLDLPNAGECYNKGKGIIEYKNGQVLIRYNAKEYTTDYAEDTLEFSLEDKFGLLTYQHKANIGFSLRLGEGEEHIYDIWDEDEEENKDRFQIHLHILEGDELPISDEMFAYYKAQFEQIGKHFEAQLGQEIEDGKTLCEVSLSYNEKDELGKGFLKVDKYFEWNKIHQDETAVLIH